MFKAVKYVMKEHKSNFKNIIKLSIAHINNETIRTSLGFWWLIIHDLIYFIVFTFFRTLMSGDSQIDGMHRVIYLLTGLIPWFFMSEVLNKGSNSILKSKGIVNSIKFPITTLPTIEVISIFIKRSFTFIIVFFVCVFFGYVSNFSIILFVYYFVAMFMLMFSLNLIISALIAISSDFTQLYRSITRVLMFSLPILWSFEMAKGYRFISILLKMNPMVYIILGFRSAFIYGHLPNLNYSIYFWAFVIIVFNLGCYVQYKLRKYYSDFM
ncbi:MAG: hypothetical protein FH753_03095 [Firmicutes bacterium]|nr:hypothetical protein [Bacillota bacterium]